MTARQQTLVAPAAIAETLHWLRRRHAGMVIHPAGMDSAGWPARLIACDRGFGRCTVSVAALADVRGALAVGRDFLLAGHEAGRAIRTAAMTVREILDDGHTWRLVTSLPVEMTLRRERGERRVTPHPDMLPVAVALADRHGVSIRDARLIDLSVTGCRIGHVALDERGAWDDRLDMRLIFPNADVLRLHAHIQRRAGDRPGDDVLALVFVDTDEATTRRLWQITTEIEREIARRSARDQGALPLAPSPLFVPATA